MSLLELVLMAGAILLVLLVKAPIILTLATIGGLYALLVFGLNFVRWVLAGAPSTTTKAR